MSYSLEQQNADLPFLSGGGIMGQLIRSINWSKTILGEPSDWPVPLKINLALALSSPTPMLVCWGTNYIQFYNDAFRPILGTTKHPQAMGISASETFAEIWQTIEPLFEKVIQGQSVGLNNFMVPLHRHGYLEDCYFDFSYNPIRDEQGHIGGILVICVETTEKVITNRNLLNSNEQLIDVLEAGLLNQRKIKESENNLRLVIMQAPVAIAIFRGTDFVVEIVNSRALELWGRGEQEVLNIPILKAMPELQTQGIKELLDGVYHSGEHFSATELPVNILRNGQLQTAFVNFVYEPLFDADGIINGVITIGTEVTEQVLARKKMVVANEELAIANKELAETEEYLQKLINKLSESEERLQQAIITGKMGTWSLNPATLQINASGFIRELLGLSMEKDVVMDDLMHAIDPDYRKIMNISLKNALELHLASDTEYPINNLVTGEQKWVRATGRVFLDTDGNVKEYSGLLMDITERKLDELRKNDFIGMVSHELKTPLTSLTAIIQVLNSKFKYSDDDFIAGAMEKANVQARKMSSIINGFLNISRLESGKIYLNLQRFDLKELLKEIVEEAKLTAISHTIKLNPGDDLEINADRDKIGSVISNLISNAVKYSPKGKVITIDSRITDQEVTVSVKDEGMGIKPNDIERLFERYYRVENAHTQHISGFGIGLYLSSEIVKRHGGTIGVESESSIGSTFYFSLPINN